MNDFVQLWVYLSSAPLFGLTSTLVVYVMVQAAYDRLGHAPWANPVLWSVLALGAVLLATGTPYQTYFAGAQFVHVLLGPAVVALGWPRWQRRGELKRRGVALLVIAEAAVTFAEYSPLEVKTSVVGYGRAEKHQVQRMVASLLKLTDLIASEDASDALAIAICHANREAAARQMERRAV